MTEPDESTRAAKPAPIPADTGPGEGVLATPPADAAPAGPAREGPDGAATDASPADGGRPAEIGGQKGPEPTRYGDWEGKGRCTDF